MIRVLELVPSIGRVLSRLANSLPIRKTLIPRLRIRRLLRVYVARCLRCQRGHPQRVSRLEVASCSIPFAVGFNR